MQSADSDSTEETKADRLLLHPTGKKSCAKSNSLPPIAQPKDFRQQVLSTSNPKDNFWNLNAIKGSHTQVNAT